jgi:hypothetical protein
MNPFIKVIKDKVEELMKQGDTLLAALEAFGWKDDRPRRTKPRRETQGWGWGIGDIEIPARVRVPADFIHQYHQWYAGCLALVEANMPSRLQDLERVHEGTKKPEEKGLREMFEYAYLTFDSQVAAADKIVQMKAIVGSVPNYLEGRLHDIELEVSQAYVRDQLTEAEILLKAGHIRAAGAVSGVMLERHLKLLCDRHRPPIRYTKTAGISKLNDLLKDAGVYDMTQWRKVQWMGDVRNSCDHAHTAEPRKGDVADLIAEVRKFVALFII